MQKMTERPPSTAALTLRAMNCCIEDQFPVRCFRARHPGSVDGFCAYLVGLLQDDTTLAVTNHNPVNLGILELLNADLASESTIGLVEDILSGNANLRIGQAAGECEVQGWRGDDDLGGGVKAGLVEVLHDVGDALRNTVPLGLVNCTFLRTPGYSWDRGVQDCGVAEAYVTYILKLPPTKNLRGILMEYDRLN